MKTKGSKAGLAATLANNVQLKISFSRGFAKTTLIALLLSALGLCLISFAIRFYEVFLVHQFTPPAFLSFLENGVDEFNVSAEASVAAWLSSSLLLLCSVLLMSITIAVKERHRPYLLHWGVLSGVFVLLSVNEAVPFHEKLTGPLRSLLGAGGFFYYAWVIPGLAFVLVFVLAYLRFLFHLPVGFSGLFVLAGVMYVSGALGIEMINGSWAETHDRTSDLTYQALVTVEELLEMTGTILFLYILMRYVSQVAKAE